MTHELGVRRQQIGGDPGWARRDGSRRVAALLFVVLVASVAGCANKSDHDRAAEAVQAGLQAQQAGNLDEAAKQYREALGYDPQNKYAYYDLGVIDQVQGRPQSAESNYRLALTIDPDFTVALYNLAILRTDVDPQEAITLYQHVVRIDRNWAAAHFNLGVLLRKVGKNAEGDAEVLIGTQLDPTLVDPLASSPSPGASAAQTSSAPATP
jgi:tetratricopeptide (TPR) repeat protein